MDCRWTFFVAVALAASAAGCDRNFLWPGQHDPLAKAAEDAEKEKDKEKDKDDKSVWVVQTKLKPDALVGYGGVLEDRASSAEKSPAERERLLELAREKYQQGFTTSRPTSPHTWLSPN